MYRRVQNLIDQIYGMYNIDPIYVHGKSQIYVLTI